MSGSQLRSATRHRFNAGTGDQQTGIEKDLFEFYKCFGFYGVEWINVSFLVKWEYSKKKDNFLSKEGVLCALQGITCFNWRSPKLSNAWEGETADGRQQSKNFYQTF